MQLIAVDVGNTAIKILVAHSDPDLERWFTLTSHDFTPSQLSQLELPQAPAFWSLCSVDNATTDSIQNWIGQHRQTDIFHEIQVTDVPLACDVQSPQQLGRDRLLAAWAAVKQIAAPAPVIVVDAGTAVTIDIVDQAAVFQGGLIFPGLESALTQLTQNTAALPNLSSHQSRQDGLQKIGQTQPSPQPWGKSTDMAILKGVYQSQIAAISGIVDSLLTHQHLAKERGKNKVAFRSAKVASFRGAKGDDRQSYFSLGPETTQVFLTGGGIAELLDAQQYLPTKFPSHWKHVPNLVLHGAVEIGKRLMSQ